MTTRAGKWLRTPVWKLPKWGWIAAAIAVAAVAFAIVISVGDSSPSASQQPVALAVPSTHSTGSGQAVPASADKPVAPVAVAPSKIEASVTPGIYTLNQVNQFSDKECRSDAAKAWVCFFTFAYEGDVKRGKAILTHGHPLATEWVVAFREGLQAFVKKEGVRLVGFQVFGLSQYRLGWVDEPTGKGSFIPGKYVIGADFLLDPQGPWPPKSTAQWDTPVLLGEDGKWLVVVTEPK